MEVCVLGGGGGGGGEGRMKLLHTDRQSGMLVDYSCDLEAKDNPKT